MLARCPCGDECRPGPRRARGYRALLTHAWRSSQLVGSQVAASVAEQKSSDHRGELLRFVQRGNADTDELRARNASQSKAPARVRRR